MSVYFARVKGYVKIGYSAKPLERSATITTGSCITPSDVSYGDRIHLLGWVPGDRKVERSLHRRFAHLRVVGEWYWDDDAFDRLIAADPFGLIAPEASMQLIVAMDRYPTIPRADIQRILDEDRAEKLADTESDLAKLSTFFTPEFLAAVQADTATERAKDRAYWRSQREVAA